MISAQMQPIRMGILTDLAPTVEAYMATYLAAYNADPVSARMLLAYQRAWGVSDIIMFPRVDGGRPGFALLRWYGDGVQKAIVAIEGTSERTSWWNRTSGATGSLTQGTLPGRYWGTAVTYANQIKTLLDTTGLFGAILARPNSLIEFAGFSIGAGIAEQLTYIYKAQMPVRQIFLYKFASPRFGNRRWNAGRNRQVPVENWYTRDDPAHFVPFSGTRLSFSEGILSNPILESYERDPIVRRIEGNGEAFSTYNSTFVGGDVGAIASYYQTLNESNPWFWHDRNQYRNAFQHYVWTVGNDVLMYRLNSLEHNDENTWQLNWAPGRAVNIDMLQLSDPVPPDLAPSTPSQFSAVQSPPPAQVVLPQQGADWDGSGGEDCDWAPSRPPATSERRSDRRRRVPAM